MASRTIVGSRPAAAANPPATPPTFRSCLERRNWNGGAKTPPPPPAGSGPAPGGGGGGGGGGTSPAGSVGVSPVGGDCSGVSGSMPVIIGRSGRPEYRG